MQLEQLQVVCRIRPALQSLDKQSQISNFGQIVKLSEYQQTEESQDELHQEQSQSQINFTFDKVFSEEFTQESIYEYFQPYLKLPFINTCFFMVGSSNSGKSHTLRGDRSGILMKSFEDLITLAGSNPCYSMKLKVYQVYQEEVIDLITNQQALQPSFQLITNISQLHFFLRQALKNRPKVIKNLVHVIFEAAIFINNFKQQSITFVELAGTENLKKIDQCGFFVAQSLNSIFEHLKNQLIKIKFIQQNVKLIQMLQDQLDFSQNCHVIFIATLSPDLQFLESNIVLLGQLQSLLNLARASKSTSLNRQESYQAEMRSGSQRFNVAQDVDSIRTRKANSPISPLNKSYQDSQNHHQQTQANILRDKETTLKQFQFQESFKQPQKRGYIQHQSENTSPRRDKGKAFDK